MEKTNSYLAYKVGKEIFATNATHIQSIIEYREPTVVPDLSEEFIGVINLRGKVLPVVDARIKLGLEKSELTLNTCIVVFENKNSQQKMTGLLVDAVSEVLEIEDNEIKPTPSTSKKSTDEYIIGVYLKDDKFIMLLDANILLWKNEELIIE